MPAGGPIGFVPQISPDVPWHTAQHLRLLYQKVNNHSAAFTAVTKLIGNGSGTTQTTIENFGGGGGGNSQIPGLGGVNNQFGSTTYTTTVADNGVLLVLDDAAPIAITLTTGISSPWMLFVTNIGTGTATLTPMTGLINAAADLTLPFDYSAIIFFDGIDFWATVIPIVPKTIAAIAGEFLNSYDATTGLFTQAGITSANVAPASGATGARPTVHATGQPYFDTTLGIPIWWSGTNWVNASGVTV